MNLEVVMIKIDKIKINNFRSFKNTDNYIENFNVLNVFTGRNNVGKTNVLRAINLFFNPDIYDPQIDRNMIKQITKGASKEPVITIDFVDEELEIGKTNRYQIYCNLNKPKSELYKTNSKSPKLNSSSKIKTYLDKKFKCVYLSTTDQVLSSQAYELVNDMILQYFKKKHKAIKETVEKFEEQYKTLLNTFTGQISDIESDLNVQFELFRENSINISPRLTIQERTKITDFLLSNISLKLDDDYAQVIDAKGAGVQRTSVILLTFFLLNEIFQSQNKIILLDEPEAFLYPLLVSGLKNSILNMVNQDSSHTQMFITTHSREFLREINHEQFRFYNISQKKEQQSFTRSNNDEDIVKYSVVKQFDNKIKNEVLKNYGLLDEIDDHGEVIICEGPTDKNYIDALLSSKEYRPQIRYNQYIENSKDLDYKFIGKGTQSVIPILLYLDRVSQVDRKIFILLDGDDAGKEAERKINSEKTKFRKFDIEIFRLPDGQEIEDAIYSRENYVEKVIDICPEIKSKSQEFRELFERKQDADNCIEVTKEFINYHGLNVSEHQLKSLLSQNIDENNLQLNELLDAIESFFYRGN